MREEGRVVVERDWERLRNDVNKCIDALEGHWEADHEDMTDEEFDLLDERYTGLIKLLALFCGGVETMVPDFKDKTPEEVFHEKLFQKSDSSQVH